MGGQGEDDMGIHCFCDDASWAIFFVRSDPNGRGLKKWVSALELALHAKSDGRRRKNNINAFDQGGMIEGERK